MVFASVANARAIAARSPLRDPNDAYVWATAVVGGAQFVVSHNTRHFPTPERAVELIDGREYTVVRHLHEGIGFVTAIEFIEDVLGADATAILGVTPPADGIFRRRRAAPSPR